MQSSENEKEKKKLYDIGTIQERHQVPWWNINGNVVMESKWVKLGAIYIYSSNLTTPSWYINNM